MGTPCPGRNGETLEDEILVAVIGVGYVGTQLVESFSQHFKVIAYDIAAERLHIVASELPSNNVRYTHCPKALEGATHFLIAVPTALNADLTIDATSMQSAIRTIADVARRGSTIVIESSVAVGMTRNLLGPVATSHGLFIGMSPERLDLGRINPPFTTIPKVISGLDDVVPGSLASIARIYERVFSTLVFASSPEAAEMTKLYENSQRMICIAFANEMADACLSHGINPFEVSKAAATKPFGYAPYSPSVGVGGHCIPVNPYYLLSNCSFPLLKAATEATAARPSRIAQRALEYFQHVDANKDGSRRARVLVVGIGFKFGQSGLCHSPGISLLNELRHMDHVDVKFADPLVAQEKVPLVSRLDETEWNEESLQTFDLIIVCVKQPGLDYGLLRGLQSVKVEMWSD